MGRRSHNKHIERSREFVDVSEQEKIDRYKVVAWCGEDQIVYGQYANAYGFQKHETSACTKCAKKYWADFNKRNKVPYTFADSIAGSVATTEGAHRTFRYHKSAYPVLDATGGIVGYVAIENGWGKSWDFYIQRHEYGSTVTELPGYHHMFSEKPEGSEYTKLYNFKGYSSKEEVLKDIDAYRRKGKTFSTGEITEQAMEYRAEKARREAEEQEKRAQYDRDVEARREKAQSDKEAMRVRLKELLDNPFLGNYDRDTIFELAKLAGYSQEAINA